MSTRIEEVLRGNLDITLTYEEHQKVCLLFIRELMKEAKNDPPSSQWVERLKVFYNYGLRLKDEKKMWFYLRGMNELVVAQKHTVTHLQDWGVWIGFFVSHMPFDYRTDDVPGYAVPFSKIPFDWQNI